MKVERLQGLPAIRIRASLVALEGVEREVLLDEEWMSSLLTPQYRPRGSGVTVRFHARAHGDHVEARGVVRCEVGFDCSRCAEETSLAVDASWSVLFLEPDTDGVELGDEGEGTSLDGDLGVAELSDGVADLEETVAEALVLAMPPYPLCRPDCRGRCANCGANLSPK